MKNLYLLLSHKKQNSPSLPPSLSHPLPPSLPPSLPLSLSLSLSPFFPTGKVWSLQHTCRIIIRKNLGPSKRRRLKELPLPPHLIAFLSTLPISCSEELHANWERRRSSKSEVVRKRGEARRKGAGREGKKGGLHLLRQLHHPHPRSS